MGRVLHLGPSCHGPSFASWAELAWADFYVGRVGFGPSCPAPVTSVSSLKLSISLEVFLRITNMFVILYSI